MWLPFRTVVAADDLGRDVLHSVMRRSRSVLMACLKSSPGRAALRGVAIAVLMPSEESTVRMPFWKDGMSVFERELILLVSIERDVVQFGVLAASRFVVSQRVAALVVTCVTSECVRTCGGLCECSAV